jgi:hypothetical protein
MENVDLSIDAPTTIDSVKMLEDLQPTDYDKIRKIDLPNKNNSFSRNKIYKLKNLIEYRSNDPKPHPKIATLHNLFIVMFNNPLDSQYEYEDSLLIINYYSHITIKQTIKHINVMNSRGFNFELLHNGLESLCISEHRKPLLNLPMTLKKLTLYYSACVKDNLRLNKIKIPYYCKVEIYIYSHELQGLFLYEKN